MNMMDVYKFVGKNDKITPCWYFTFFISNLTNPIFVFKGMIYNNTHDHFINNFRWQMFTSVQIDKSL
jgi:hypothetical protein